MSGSETGGGGGTAGGPKLRSLSAILAAAFRFSSNNRAKSSFDAADAAGTAGTEAGVSADGGAIGGGAETLPKPGILDRSGGGGGRAESPEVSGLEAGG